jgi:hypothetical protein
MALFFLAYVSVVAKNWLFLWYSYVLPLSCLTAYWCVVEEGGSDSDFLWVNTFSLLRPCS